MPTRVPFGMLWYNVTKAIVSRMEKRMQFLPINANGISSLENDWGRWYASDPALFELSRPYLEHARSVCGESADPSQAIYRLLDDDGTISSEAFSAEALAKVVYNEADAELCVVWNTPHPKYETHPPPLGTSGYLTACFIKEAIHLAKTSLGARLFAHLYAKCGQQRLGYRVRSNPGQQGERRRRRRARGPG